MIALGLRWADIGSERLTWRDLRVIAQTSGPGTAIYRATSPGGAGWSATDYLLADVFDAVERNTYALIKANGGKPRTPKPHPRPGVKSTSTETKRTGTTLLTREQLTARFKWDAKREEG